MAAATEKYNAHPSRARIARAYAIAERAPRGGGTPISMMCMPTAGDPARACRNLASFIDNARAHGRNMGWLVADDAGSPDAQRRCREALRALGRSRECAIEYAGRGEKRAFARALGAEVCPDDIEFALFNPERLPFTAGANRNAFLLRTTGRAIFAADDDVACRLTPAPNASSRLSLSARLIPLQGWFFPDRAAALAACADADFFGLNEALLGVWIGARARTAECATNVDNHVDNHVDDAVDVDHADDALIARLTQDQVRVRVVQTGSLGTGINWPPELLQTDGPTRLRAALRAVVSRRLSQPPGDVGGDQRRHLQ